MEKKVKILKNWSKINNEHNWKQGCWQCEKSFEEKEKYTRIDIGTTIFRGDDEVFCLCNECLQLGFSNLAQEYGFNEKIYNLK